MYDHGLQGSMGTLADANPTRLSKRSMVSPLTVRIKEGDEWKGAFTMHIGSFEPTVIFFGMTNSPAIFVREPLKGDYFLS